MTSAQYTELKEAAKQAGMDMSAFAKYALRAKQALDDEKRQGHKIFVGTDRDTIMKELIFL